MSIYLFAEFVESFNTKLVTDYKISLLETKVNIIFLLLSINYNFII